jgi:uncharacterized protein
MAIIEKHVPGSFCWIELATTDQPAAKEFYGHLFGWSANDMPMAPGDFYTMFQIEARTAAAGCTLRPEQAKQGVPPHWTLYIAVESADASAKLATELGGTVLAPPFDVYDAGRMAVVRDPLGAAFCVWQPMKSPGTGIGNVPGTLCWADLSTTDQKRSQDFYTRLFGWQIVRGEKDPGDYLHIKNGEAFIGGIPSAAHRDPKMPPHWLAYFLVADCSASATKAASLGGHILHGPTFMENVGHYAVIADPQGAVFAIYQSISH